MGSVVALAARAAAVSAAKSGAGAAANRFAETTASKGNKGEVIRFGFIQSVVSKIWGSGDLEQLLSNFGHLNSGFGAVALVELSRSAAEC